MRRLSWLSLTLGAALGSAATAAIVLLPCGGEDTGNQGPAQDPSTGGPAAPVNRDRPGAPAAEPSSATNLGAGDQARRQEGGGQIAHWLSGKLEEAYKTEALPEIIGNEAGQEAGRQTLAYTYDEYDVDSLKRELDSTLERVHDIAQLQEPWSLGRQDLDCERAPCLLHLEIETSGDNRECDQAFRQVLSRLDAATATAILGVEYVSQHQGGCSATVDVHTARSRQRWQELNEGIEGWMKTVNAATSDRKEALRERSSAE